MQRLLSAYGSYVGKHPAKFAAAAVTLCCGLSLGWIKAYRREDVMPTLDELEVQWSNRGGHLERELKIMQELHKKDPWEPRGMVTMFVGKGSLEGHDVMRPDVMEELLPLYKRFHDMTVTTKSGLAYSARDLCFRGAVPDYPGSAAACAAWEASNKTDSKLMAACSPTPIFPCLIMSPMDCFSETAEALHGSYAAVDPIVDKMMPPEMLGRSYTARPSFRNLSAAEMKQVVSTTRITGTKGCPWWTETTVYSPSAWGGGLEWTPDKSVLTKVSAFMFVFSLDGPRRSAFRMKLSKPTYAVQSEIEEAIELLDRAWALEVKEFAKGVKSVEVTNLRSTAERDLLQEATEPQVLGMILCCALMSVFMAGSLGSWHYPLLSRVDIGFLGLGLVILSILASGGALLLLGVKFNTAIIMSLPFLALGIGVDDLFVLIRYFSGLGLPFIQEMDYPKITSEVLKQAGVGVSLTSFCNICAFLAGGLLPVPAMADFCLGAAIVAVINYFLMMTAVPALLVLEARRIKQKRAEVNVLTRFCHRRALHQAQSKGAELAELSENDPPTMERRFVRFLRWNVAGAFTSKVGRLSVLLLATALVGLSIAGGMQRTIGYRPQDFLNPSGDSYRPMELLFERFTQFPSKLCFVDVDVPTNQLQMLELYDEVTKHKNTAPFELPPYLSLFHNYIGTVSSFPVPGLANTTMADLGWRLDSTMNHPLLAPAGIASQDPKTFYSQLYAWAAVPLNDPSSALLPENQGYVAPDLSGFNEFSRIEGAGPTAPLKLSFFNFYLTDLNNDEEYLSAIKAIRGIVEKSSLKGNVFPYGRIFTYWSIFEELDDQLRTLLLICLGVIGVLTGLVLRSILAGCLSTLACAMIVLEIWGIALFYLRSNIFVASAIMAAAGMSVEFTAHLVAAFYLEEVEVSRRQRLGNALAQVGPAVIQGSMSTLCAVVPMSFTPIPFVWKYLLSPFALTVALGMLNGLVILPVLLDVFSFRCKKSGAPETPANAPGPALPTILQPASSERGDKDDAASV